MTKKNTKKPARPKLNRRVQWLDCTKREFDGIAKADPDGMYYRYRCVTGAGRWEGGKHFPGPKTYQRLNPYYIPRATRERPTSAQRNIKVYDPREFAAKHATIRVEQCGDSGGDMGVALLEAAKNCRDGTCELEQVWHNPECCTGIWVDQTTQYSRAIHWGRRDGGTRIYTFMVVLSDFHQRRLNCYLPIPFSVQMPHGCAPQWGAWGKRHEWFRKYAQVEPDVNGVIEVLKIALRLEHL